MKHIHIEKVDYCAVREHGNVEEHHLLAKRTFNVLRPLFAHLADEQYTHYLDNVVRDSTAVVFRGIFLVDEASRDIGLVGVRIAETFYDGQTIAHLTIHVGLHPEARGERHSALLILKEIFRYRLRYPLRPFFIIDTPVSAASYRKMYKGVVGLYPTPNKEVPNSLWPLCEFVANEKGWLPIKGCPKEARFVNRPLTDLARTDSRRNSDEFRSMERWFSATTKGIPGSGVLTIASISYRNLLLSMLKQTSAILLKPLKRRSGDGLVDSKDETVVL